ncbi:DNA ligase [bioreactor metagenome]|uniref:DNA ligase (NAD(+)) n=1 Tax=bioreactor metagenome TaxID=1076179 RepID=A0A644YKG8_9ZZZZ
MHTVAELEALIARHNELYWKQGAPEISDVEYDNLMRELELLAPDHPLLNLVNAPQVAGLGKVRHKEPMLSLDKAYSLDKVLEWVDKYGRGSDEALLIQPKYDGISARWDDNMLVTRGDGDEGEDISDKAPLIEVETADYTGPLRRGDHVRGEIVIRDDDFATLYRNIRRKNGEPYKNSRNAVAGIMGLKEIDALKAQGAKLTLIDYRKISYRHTRRELAEYFPDLVAEIEALPYPTDGVVIKFADEAYARSLGNTAHHPRGEIAFKFTNIRRSSILRKVVWSFGKNCLTPVAEIDPVEIGGVTITHATLHNVQNVIDRDIHVGDTVEVERAGDVIPYIVNALPGAHREPVLIDRCPSCGAELVRRGPEIACPDPECPETRLQNLLAAVRNIGIERLGEPTLRKMAATLGVRTLKDIFALDRADVLKLEGFKEKSADNLCREIAKAREVNDYQLLAALNVPHVGVNVARLILRELSFSELRGADEVRLAEIAGVGPERARALVAVLCEQSGFIDGLLGAVRLRESGRDAAELNLPTICFTGKMPEKRDFYEALAAARGYRAVDAVTRELALLVAADVAAAGNKLNKAREYGVKIMSLEEFLAGSASGAAAPATAEPEPKSPPEQLLLGI